MKPETLNYKSAGAMRRQSATLHVSAYRDWQAMTINTRIAWYRQAAADNRIDAAIAERAIQALEWERDRAA